MTISIVIPVFNGAAFLEEAIKSAVSQTIPADEVLIFVHDSNDDSEKIARKYEPSVKVIVENGNLNVGEAWNRAIELASSEFVLFLHADDLLVAECVKYYHEATKSNADVSLCYGCCGEMDEFSKPVGGTTIAPVNKTDFLEIFFSKGICVGTWGVLIKKSAFSQCRFRTDIDFALDHEWNFRMAYEGEFIGIPKTICYLRRHGGRVSQRPKKPYGAHRRHWFLTADIPPAASPEQTRLYRDFLLRLNADTAFYAFWNGQKSEKLAYVEFFRKHSREGRLFLNYSRYNFLRAVFVIYILTTFRLTGSFLFPKAIGSVVRLLENPLVYIRIAWNRLVPKSLSLE